MIVCIAFRPYGPVACSEDFHYFPVRSSISIIPQESQMFEGTMRENIDPTGLHEDANIWTALEQAHLKDFVQSLPGALDAKVQEGGASMSSGQRQLLCFARALLRKVSCFVYLGVVRPVAKNSLCSV
jgi:ABC-type multidrug transport system fused ATPase/permease subunit